MCRFCMCDICYERFKIGVPIADVIRHSYDCHVSLPVYQIKPAVTIDEMFIEIEKCKSLETLKEKAITTAGTVDASTSTGDSVASGKRRLEMPEHVITPPKNWCDAVDRTFVTQSDLNEDEEEKFRDFKCSNEVLSTKMRILNVINDSNDVRKVFMDQLALEDCVKIPVYKRYFCRSCLTPYLGSEQYFKHLCECKLRHLKSTDSFLDLIEGRLSDDCGIQLRVCEKHIRKVIHNRSKIQEKAERSNKMLSVKRRLTFED